VTAPETQTKFLITPEIAEDWLERYNLDNYRPLYDVTARQYARDMVGERWIYTSDAIKFINRDGNVILGDGQTRLEAIVLSGMSQEIDVVTDLNPDAVNYMDIGRKRSMSNILANNGYKSTNLLQSIKRLEIDVITVRKGGPAQGRNATFPEIKEMIDGDEDIQWAVESVRNIPVKILNRTVAGYCYLTFHKIDPDDAAVFFTKITDPANLPEDSPLLKLHKRLTNGSWYTKGRQHRLQQVITLIRAWNAWREGPSTRVTLTPLPSKEADLKIPEPI
jgi:hypothetical protein